MHPTHLFVLLALNLAWGLNFLAIKYAIDEIPAIFSAGLRFALVFLVLFPFLKIVPGKMNVGAGYPVASMVYVNGSPIEHVAVNELMIVGGVGGGGPLWTKHTPSPTTYPFASSLTSTLAGPGPKSKVPRLCVQFRPPSRWLTRTVVDPPK